MIKNNKEKNFISAVVYAHNCEKTITNFVKSINKILNKNFNSYEIIVVDDFSNDNTIKNLESICKNREDTSVSIIKMSYYHGLELSMNAGVDLSIGDFVFEFDTTNIDYDDELIMEVYRKSLEGNDIVSAVPDRKLKLTSKLFYYVFNKNSKNFNSLTTETFTLISRRAINRVKEINISIPYRKAIYSNCGLRKEVIKYETKEGSQTNRDCYKYKKDVAMDSLILFTDVTYKIAIAMSFIMMGLLLFSGIYTLITFFNASPVEGWTTTMLVLSFAFFGIFIILTILIKYLSVILNLIFRKQNYLIESVYKKNL